jgi:quercetin dioxygenase-like cupin family protein
MTASSIGLKPLVVLPEEAESIRPFGLDVRVLLTTENTGGATSVILGSHPPGEGPPDHFHRSQEECIFVLDGTYQVTIDGVTRIAGPGSLLFIPRGSVHSFKNIGSTIGRMLDWSLPGGQDHFFRAISSLASSGQFGAAAAIAISEQHDTHFPSSN